MTENKSPTLEEFKRGRAVKTGATAFIRGLVPGQPTLVPENMRATAFASFYNIAKLAGMRVSLLTRGDEIWILRREAE